MLGFWKLLRAPLNFGGEKRTLFEDLIAKALKGSLDPLQQEKVVLELENYPELVYHCGLTPEKLPDLVENNPRIAAQVVTNLVNSPEISEYFRVVVNMEISIQTTEVVNMLLPVLPTEFLHTYISNCFSACRGIKNSRLQNRLVRLICVFLQSLVRNKLIKVDDIFIEAEAFCMEFWQIREARNLLGQLE